MKRNEIQPCALCGKGVMHDGNIMFTKVRLERFVVDLKAIERRHGLETFFGGGQGGAVLAGVMGTDDDLAVSVDDGVEVLICDPCSMQPSCLAYVHEQISERKATAEAKTAAAAAERES